MKKNGAIYIRVSTDKQEELSPDAQKRLLLEYAANHDILVSSDYIFQDNGISGRKAEKRPAFQQMIALAKSKEHPIDCIIVWKFSRFARNQEESILYKSLLKKNNVDVVSISENTTGEFGTLIERIIEWMDEYYSIRLSGEVMRGMTENAMRGNYQASPPVGYTHVGNGSPPIINPETSVIPLTMRKLFLEDGKNSRRIAVHCNSQGWRTKRGNLFYARDVEYILMNPFYAGKIRWNYTNRGRKLKPEEEIILVNGRHEALWSYEDCMEMTNMIQAKKEYYSKSRKKRDVAACKHWLSGMLFCSSCGHTLAYSGTAGKKGFQCWAYAKGKCSVSHFIGIDKITAYVIDGLKEFIKSDLLEYQIVHSAVSNADSGLIELTKRLNRIAQREKRAKTAYLDGIDSKEEYKENKLMFAEERKKIEGQIEMLTAKKVPDVPKSILDQMLIHNIQDVIAILENDDIDYEQKGNALRSVVERIIFNRSNTTLDFSFQLQLSANPFYSQEK
uniref:recombinase family protein n=1 Tax=Agathobacter sp. TaxID=2021311 RepID=UPI004056056D